MHLLVMGKSAYSRVIDKTPVPITIAGHTAQFMRPLISYALAHGMAVSYAYPLRPSGCLMLDPRDAVPDGVVEVPFNDLSAQKAPLHIGWLSVEASCARPWNGRAASTGSSSRTRSRSHRCWPR
ncbi:hypothetical protein AB0B21_15865 [Streptomyces rimosus]|uniref:hypothetical protein n=1 Tax=Streptomyces rimosus TaxID=1927 RepID=UPI0005199E30|nr:hypothetical protein [Streptomyces rimosus]